MSHIRASVFLIFALSAFTCRVGMGDDIAKAQPQSQNTSDELLRKYLAALDRIDINEARLILERANRDAPGQPATELMERHMRLVGVAKVSQAKVATDTVYTISYGVADIVVPEPTVEVMGTHDEKARSIYSSKAGFERLIDAITSTVDPKTWQQNGGIGTISPYKANTSLVISQTDAVHKKITDLLEQLRRLQDVQVVLEARVITLDPADAKAVVVLNSALDQDTASKLVDFAQNSRRSSLEQFPKFTLVNGQKAIFGGEIAIVGEQAQSRCAVQPFISNDRTHIELTVATFNVNDANSSKGFLVTENIKDGSSLLVDMGGWDALALPVKEKIARGSKLLLLITPRITIQEEEEERLPTSRKK